LRKKREGIPVSGQIKTRVCSEAPICNENVWMASSNFRLEGGARPKMEEG